ncbi:MAG: ParB/RepB/Spo0J family partition protein [Acidimicrobiia bacterium]|nr:ParB/RepB/Spo0J family partition protein [Acidimicrobiia bacterium]
MGDGLDALLGIGGDDDEPGGRHQPPVPAALGQLEAVPIEAIAPNPNQPRARFDEAELLALSESIRAVGILQPLLVRRIDEDRYELIAGERRLRAARMVGLVAVPAVIRHTDERGSLEQAIVENLHRADLNPLEEAAAYRQLIDDFGLTQEAVADRVGKSRSAVANTLRLFQLPSAVQRLIAANELSAGHARALLAFPNPAVQEELAVEVVRQGLSVRAVEELVRAASHRSSESDPTARPSRSKPAALLEVEQLLGDRLDTRVEVALSKDRGRLVVEFADLEDLDRILRLLS